MEPETETHPVKWAQFKAAADKAGVMAQKCTADHWQVRGANIVNFYPTTGTVFIHGQSQGHRHGLKAAEIVALAVTLPSMAPLHEREKRLSTKAMSKIRRKLFKKRPVCTWCGLPMAYWYSTVDHRIPLARGGSNLEDNLVLACRACNTRRGHDMPELNLGGESASTKE